MPNIIYETLDPLFEVVGLISVGRNFDETKKETLKALEELGVDGEKFYSSHMQVFEDYVQEFMKHYQPGENDALFFDSSSFNLLLMLLCLLFENRDLLASIDNLEDSEINAEIVELCCQMNDFQRPQSITELEQLMAFIDTCTFSENEKWKLLSIMKNPKERLKQLLSTIGANTPAFERAQKKIKIPLDRLIAQYVETIRNGDAEMFGKYKKSLSETADIYPSLVFAVSQLMFSNTCYYGLLSTQLLTQEGPDQEMLLRCLKALSDGSRLEILRSLRKKPKYNLEIAEQLGLTAATMSHHMSILLACGFVDVNKQDSRVYYHLKEDAVRRFVNMLEQQLL